MRNRRDAYIIPDKADLIAGRVEGHPDGFGFVIAGDEKTSLVAKADRKDIFLSAQEMRSVLHGDRVLVRVIGVDRRGRPEGKVVEVTERANTRLIARVVEEHAVVVHGLRVRADRPGGAGWPAEDELRARRIVIVPRWTDLLSARPRVESVRVEDAYVSLLRTRDGRLRVLPALLDGPAGPPGASSALVIDNVELRSSTLDLYDATVARTPYRISLQALTADIGPVVLPALDTRVDIDLSGIVKGPRGDGRLALKGWLVPASKDAELAVSLRDVDLRALQPYLVRAAETDVKQGRMRSKARRSVRSYRSTRSSSRTSRKLSISPSAAARSRWLSAGGDRCSRTWAAGGVPCG